MICYKAVYIAFLVFDDLSEPLVAGLNQDICLTINLSPELHNEADAPLKLVASEGLRLVSEYIKDDCSLSLASADDGEQCQINISCFALIPDTVQDFICHEVSLSSF